MCVCTRYQEEKKTRNRDYTVGQEHQGVNLTETRDASDVSRDHCVVSVVEVFL